MRRALEKIIEKKFPSIINFILFGVLTVWWIVLFFMDKNANVGHNLIWGVSYQAVAVWGAFWGLFISRTWGGLKSVMGQAIIFFSLGLLLQAFGQSIFSYYNLVLGVDMPYPSISDIGFFGSIPLYIYAVLLLGRASGVAISLRSVKSKIVALLIPAAILSMSYLFFLKGYEFDWSNPLRVFLDFGYPIGQALYISVAILVFVLSKNLLGGIMREKIIFVLGALFVQYFADYNFLYQALQGTWVNGGYGDFIYLIAYFFMSYSVIRLAATFHTKE